MLKSIFLAVFMIACLKNSRPDARIADYHPTYVADLHLWFRSDTGLTLNGANVSRWIDAFSGVWATQNTVADQPTYVANVINGSTAVVRFDGLSQFLKTTSVAVGTEMTVFIFAARPWTTPKNAAFFGQDSNYGNTSGLAFLTTGAAVNGWAASDLLFVGNGRLASQDPRNFGAYGALVDNTFHVVTAILGAGSSQIWLDGSAIASTISTTAITASNDLLRLGSSGAATGDYFDGDVAEIIIYKRALSVAERRHVECYMTSRYLLTAFTNC